MTPFTILVAVVALTTALVLVTSISSLAMRSGPDARIMGGQQDLTPTPAEDSGSQAGSTDGIVWMGIVIAALVLLPVVAHRAMWNKQQ